MKSESTKKEKLVLMLFSRRKNLIKGLRRETNLKTSSSNRSKTERNRGSPSLVTVKKNPKSSTLSSQLAQSNETFNLTTPKHKFVTLDLWKPQET